MYRSIVIPLDGSAFAEQALPLASAIAARTGAALRLVRVWEPPYHFVTELAPPELIEPSDDERVAAAYLDQVAERVRTSSALEVATAVLNGTVPTAILDNVRSASADLIVMTTHGRTGSAAPGSAAWRMRSCARPRCHSFCGSLTSPPGAGMTACSSGS